jgi:hypothetical protein
MSKKTIADYKAGRHFRCEGCNKTCNDDFALGVTDVKDIYMGRPDRTKRTITYYCTYKCVIKEYIKNVRVDCEISMKTLDFKIQTAKLVYKMELRACPTEYSSKTLYYIKTLCDIQRFYQAIIHKKTEYELYELKMKALHTDGLALEENHKEEERMNDILKMRAVVDAIDVEAMGNQ